MASRDDDIQEADEEATMNRSFSVTLFIVPLVLGGIVWALFGRVAGLIALGIVLLVMAFNSGILRTRSRAR